MPNNKILMALMGFVPDFNVEAFNAEMITELVGQSVEVPMHRKLGCSVKEHINNYVNNVKCVSNDVFSTMKSVVSHAVENQLAFEF